MATQKSLKTNDYGEVILDSNSLRELLLHGKNISHTKVVIDDEIELYKKFQYQLIGKETVFEDLVEEDISFDDYQSMRSSEWIFPEKYQKIDVYKWLLNKCKTEEEILRINEEYKLYEEKDLLMLLRFFIYLVDYMRENKFVWGVGRGSSVSSYILYLIGVHRVDSIKYSLSISDYLK